MRKLLLSLITIICLVAPATALAQVPTTLIPETKFESNFQCRKLSIAFEEVYFFRTELEEGTADLGTVKRFEQALRTINEDDTYEFEDITRNDVLGCALMTGRIKLMYLSIFISYSIQLLAVASGTVSILFVIIGGYKYIIGAITENKDKGKKAIINALVGLLISTGAWMIVNIVLTFLTE